MTSHCRPKGTECEFDILQPGISHQLMHCNKWLRPSLKANASKIIHPHAGLLSAVSVYESACLYGVFLSAPIDLHKTKGF